MGLAPRPGPAARPLVTLPLSLDAPSPGAEGAGCAKSCWDSDCLGGFSMLTPSLGLASAGPLPGPAAACHGGKLSPQLPPCSLPSSASVDIMSLDPMSPLWPLDAPPILNTQGGIGWIGELPLRWRICLWSCWQGNPALAWMGAGWKPAKISLWVQWKQRLGRAVLGLAAWCWHQPGDASCNEQCLPVPQCLLPPAFLMKSKFWAIQTCRRSGGKSGPVAATPAGPA